MTIFMTSIRDFFAFLDIFVYGFISTSFGVFNTISNFKLVAPHFVENITERVYAFIGLFMIFKISFSLINYLIDPNKLADKTAGAGNLIKRIVISLVLVIMVPFGFDLLREAQDAIIDDRIIPQLITGDKNKVYDSNNQNYEVLMDGGSYTDKNGKEIANTMCIVDGKVIKAKPTNAGDYIGLLTFRTFYRINPLFRTEKLGGKEILTLDSGFINQFCSATSPVELLSKQNHKAPLAIANSVPYVGTVRDSLNLYYVNYMWLFSTVTGVIVLLLIISMSFDIAVRAIRLLFLEIIAPIPIISYIEPDTNKNKMFSKWFKDVWTTWLGLFIRIAAIYLVVEILDIINRSFVVKDLINSNIENINLYIPFVMLFFIIGLLMFAKQIPKVIEELFGIKSAGFTLNPLKKIKDGATGGAAIAGVAYGTVGALGGGISGARAGKDFGSPMRGALFGATSGFLGGTKSKSISDSFSKNMSQVYKNMTGSELSNFSLQRSLMNFDGSGNKALAEMKNYLTEANVLKNEKETSLTNSKFMTSSLSKDLNDKGYNPDEELKKYNSRLNYEKEYKEYDDYIKDAENFSVEEKQRFSKEINDAMTAREKVQKSLNELPKYDKEIAAKLEKYGENLSTQNVLRNEIQAIEKSISTYNDEKKDIIKGYNLDLSDPKNIEKAKKTISDIRDGKFNSK